MSDETILQIAIYLISALTTGSTILWRIKELEKKVEKHNNLIERTYQLEKRADVMDEKIKVANHRIEDLEKEAAKK